MIHEYIEDLDILASAFERGHDVVPRLLGVASRLSTEAERLLAR